MNELNGMFVDSDEKQIAVLGGGYLRNFLASGILEKGFCAISNRRAYFKGKCYYKENGSYRVSKEERIVDLGDVTGSGFILANLLPKIVKITMLVSSLFFIALALLLPFTATSSIDDEEVISFIVFGSIGIVILIILVCLAFKKQKIFEISYAGGAIAFKTSSYDEREMQQFQKALRKAKDEYISVHKLQTVVQQVPAQPQQASMSVADELKQYKDLLDAGVITQEEFDKMKSRLLR